MNAIPEQADCAVGVAFTVGLGLTVTVEVVLFEHPPDVEAVIMNAVVC